MVSSLHKHSMLYDSRFKILSSCEKVKWGKGGSLPCITSHSESLDKGSSSGNEIKGPKRH